MRDADIVDAVRVEDGVRGCVNQPGCTPAVAPVPPARQIGTRAPHKALDPLGSGQPAATVVELLRR